jgi:hypothetical protein
MAGTRVTLNAGQKSLVLVIVATLELLPEYAECASCPDGCLEPQSSNFRLGHVPELPIPVPLR